jgi:hypothetical protein
MLLARPPKGRPGTVRFATSRRSARPIVDVVGGIARINSYGPWPGFVQSRYVAAEVVV